MGTVLAGLALFAFLLLPLALWGATRRSPLAVARQFAQALLLAFGTSTSAAALPLAMQVGGRGGGGLPLLPAVEQQAAGLRWQSALAVWLDGVSAG